MTGIHRRLIHKSTVLGETPSMAASCFFLMSLSAECVFFTQPVRCQLAYVTCYVFNAPMPTMLSCPEIARRTGYSRMHVTRMARKNEIPGERIITKGGHFRYELTPELAEWIRVMRARPRYGRLLDSDFYMFARRANKKRERVRDRVVITEEITLLLKEIERRVSEFLDIEPDATNDDITKLRKIMVPLIMELMRLDTNVADLQKKGYFDPMPWEKRPEGKANECSGENI